MKNKTLFVLCILIFYPMSASPIDFTIGGGVDSASYSPNDKGPAGDTFAPELLPLYFAEFKGDFAVEYNYGIRAAYDPIWLNTISGNVGYHFGNVNMGLGFFIGDSDLTFQALDAGFSGRAGFEFPGIFFVNAGIASSLDGGSDSAENATRRLFSAQAGFWLPHIFFTFDFERRDFIEQPTNTSKISRSRTMYKLSMDIYSKNTPYRIGLIFGGQSLSRKFEDSSTPEAEVSFDTLIIGMRFFDQVSRTFAWFVEGEAPFKMDELPNIMIFFRATAGVTFSYNEK
ncbi:MAG: hypothetical protein LBF83_01925 [Spirochaetaceae bacterium]|jgi:hypothetical protein|nr:hypothetical protein [Spirochaetaceae bacterium]